MNASIVTGPKRSRNPGKVKGTSRATRNMYIGSALLLNSSDPPSSGPHHKLCLPNEKSQSSNRVGHGVGVVDLSDDQDKSRLFGDFDRIAVAQFDVL